MTERGMIFNGEMVRAILDGRKTQTRRIMAPQPADDIERGIFPNPEAIGWKSSLRHKHGSTTAHFCPYGKPGERIWVRETWQAIHDYCDENGHVDERRYARSIPRHRGNYWHPVYEEAWGNESREDREFPWRPSIHMPRWASRILLEITDVRVERLKSISDGDAIREGCSTADMKSGDCVADVFARLWASIYGSDSWNANPWVWVIAFKRVEGGAA
ncbi:TPA: hypothetical protein MEA38_003457 [Klebsiella variicola]|nr:hypothetical protein [Klebsiella variicola]